MDPDEAREYAESWEDRQLMLEVKQENKKIESQERQEATKVGNRKSGLIPSTDNKRDKIEEIKNRLDIVTVIDQDVGLHHIGGSEYAGTVGTAGKSGESLKVNQYIQAWKDHKNNRKGDVLDWIGYHAGYKDTRGADFPEVLRIAAKLAGVELEDMTEEQKNAAKEKADIHNLFTEAADIYHKNLTPELYHFIKDKWGITPETVDRLNIGYAKISRNLKDLDKTTLKKSGLVYVNGGMAGGEVFTGRIIFPYWKNGKVVYLIGRQTKETPLTKKGKEPSKYQKLLVHSDKFPYVSPSVQNSYFYGEDSLRGPDYCIITEGVADCIAMSQAGFPCISPVTVTFREADIPKLIKLTKELKRVYICNDNEENKTGLKGALSTAEEIEGVGIEARLIELPKPEGIDKIDIADYMKENSPGDFRGLIDSSVRLWSYKLSQQVILASADSFERLRAFRAFISNDIHGMISEEWNVFVNNEVPVKFGLKLKDVKNTIEEIGKSRQEDNKSEISEPAEEPEAKPETDERLSRYPEKIRKLAMQILEEGDPLEFMLDTWNLRHVGDKNIGENCLCAVASTYILNTRGLHVKPSGDSGKGKSDAVEKALDLLPEDKFINGSMSSKALFYHKNLKAGTIIYSDDANFNEDTIATVKQSTSSFQKPTTHITVSNHEFEEHSIPARCSFWFSTVDGIQDDQLANRFLNADIDGSETQDKRVYAHIKTAELDLNLLVDDDVLICRCMFDILGKELYKIKIPYINAIEWTNIKNRRNFSKFLDILRSVTFFNAKQRETINGYYIADVEDYNAALNIYTGTSKNNATNLTEREFNAINYIKGKQVTVKQIADYLGVSRERAFTIIKGLLKKVPGLHKIDKTETVGSKDGPKTSTRADYYEYQGGLGLDDFGSVATIDYKKAEDEREAYIKTFMEESVTTVIGCNSTVTPGNITVKTRTIDRINSNVIVKSKNVTRPKNTHDTKQLNENIHANFESLSQTEKECYTITVDNKKASRV